MAIFSPSTQASGAMNVIGAGNGFNPATQGKSAMEEIGATPATPSPIVSLPKPPVSPTGPTGVATSSLADQTTATQAQGTQNLQSAVDQQAQTKAANAANPQVSIVDLLNSQGKPSDFTSRATLAQQAGIQNYVGTAQQNAQLIGYVNNPPVSPQGATGATTTGGSTTGTTTQGNTTQTSTTGNNTGGNSTSTTDANGNPIQPNTGSPGDIYSAAITQVQKDISDALDERNQEVQQIMNGTFPLSAYQQQLMTSTQNQFSAIAQLQMTANKSYEGGVALAGNRLGTNLTSPQEYLAEQNQAVTDSLNKINNLDATAAKTLADLQQSFMDKDYTYINDSYTALEKTLSDKQAALSDLQKRTDDLFTSTRDYNQKADEFQQSQQQSKEEFDATYAQNQAKFVAQYAGLIDPNTGLFKPSADPTTLPGVTSLPQGISGQGSPAGYYVDVGQIADKGLATYIEQAAKKNGYGIVDTTSNKTFNQSLAAYSGLQAAISSGAINGHDEISKDIAQRNPSSVITDLFLGTQPGNIQTVLGAGGANVPNLQNMTWNQALPYLQNSIYSAMGTNSTAQKYAMNPGLATTDLQTYASASPANYEAVTKLLTANPNYTDSQVMQILTSQ